MNDQPRGRHLIAADRGFATGGGLAARLVARLVAGGVRKMLDRIDAGLESGRIEVTLPDGALRSLGGRGPGPQAVVRVNHWPALVRLVTSGAVGWYKAWEKGEWTS